MAEPDPAAELQQIYDSEINVSIHWMWDGGITLRLGDEIGGYLAQEVVNSIAEVVPWFQEAIAHFYPTSTYATSLDEEVKQRAKQRIFLPPSVGASAICPHCGATNATPVMDELIAFVCRRCGQGVKVEPPKVQ